MKLSKQSLINALILATEKTSSLVFAGAQNALQEGTLEIEGYERADHFADDSKMGWTKFDPNDPKTFPPEQSVFLAFGNPDIGEELADQIFICWRLFEWDFSSVDGGDPEVKYWRPLPKPPQTEGLE